MNPCKGCLSRFGEALCEGSRGCVFEDVPEPRDGDLFQDPMRAYERLKLGHHSA